MDGEVHTYKARLVAKGALNDTSGIDYEETFSPVADIRAIRILIAIAAYYDYEIWQIDVKTAFLNGRLDEDISSIIEQPKGYVTPKISKAWNMRDMFLVYGGKPDTKLNVTGFCDASWKSDKMNEAQTVMSLSS
ncbi:retrotransposon protein, putative, ty1-copia subclass [Tanacetum coccineum]|uniref:Retrotransposon protein, putative, ty1-copia subclass n=1 Tax=Tanacetum coccineum TaxID=301880 RepID=A0ABQ5HNK7_9ASTR